MFDPLSDIGQYSKKMTIAQVVKFFIKKEIGITRAMVQNYIRIGIIPPPLEKRFYTHKHLAALVLVDYLKTVFDMSEIKTALAPHMDDEGLPLDFYADLVASLETLSAKWKKALSPQFKDDGGLLLMAHAAEIKALAAHPRN